MKYQPCIMSLLSYFLSLKNWESRGTVVKIDRINKNSKSCKLTKKQMRYIFSWMDRMNKGLVLFWILEIAEDTSDLWSTRWTAKCTHLPTTNCYLLAQKLTPHEMWYNHPCFASFKAAAALPAWLKKPDLVFYYTLLNKISHVVSSAEFSSLLKQLRIQCGNSH